MMLIAILSSALHLSANAYDAHTYRAEIHSKACEIAIASVCRSDACRDNRADEICSAAVQAVEACFTAGAPRSSCLFLAAALHESAANPTPTCASDRCNELCGKATSGHQRRCRIRCAKPSKKKIVTKCNDSGTSFGWFQMKPRLLKMCEDVDPHDLSSAAACYTKHAQRMVRKNTCRLSRGKLWLMAFSQIAKGGGCRLSRYADLATTTPTQ